MAKVICSSSIEFVNLKIMPNEVTEEISLRDVYLILKKHIRLILSFTIGAALIALALAFILPKSYSSQSVINLAVNTERSEFKAAPNAIGLSQGFIQLVNNESLIGALEETRLEGIFKAKFDDKKSLLTLSATGTTPEIALARAQRIQTTALTYFENQIGTAVRTSLESNLAQIKVDIDSSKDNLKRLEPLLKTTQGIANNTSDTAALESNGIDPQLARANNPALVSVALQISQLRVVLAATQARQISLQSILNNKTGFKSLLGQGFQAQILAAPALAITAESPGPLLLVALATVAGLLIGLVAAFVLEAIHPATRATNSDSTLQLVNSPGD